MITAFDVDPTHEFAHELSFIQIEKYKKMAISALNKIPDYFWYVPASSSGKHHPKSSIGMGGLVRHVKAVCRIAEELLGHPLYAPFTDQEKDEIRVACLLHDGVKQGVNPSPSHTIHEHPILVRTALQPEGLDEEMVAAWHRICDLIATHMGIWTKDAKEVSTTVLDVPQTKAQLFVHMCDFLASRKIIEVDTVTEQSQLGYRKDDPNKDAWKLQPATEGQVRYIKKLFVICVERGITDLEPVVITDSQGNIVLTKGDAGTAIDTLKGKLGMQ